jgi:heme/copper-type cytochrome/quinol oxidase subunit 2
MEGVPVLPTGPQTGAQLLEIIDAITNWVFAGFVALAVVMVIIAAIQFVKDGGNPEKISEARLKLIWAAVGVAVALAAKGFVPVIQSILGA